MAAEGNGIREGTTHLRFLVGAALAALLSITAVGLLLYWRLSTAAQPTPERVVLEAVLAMAVGLSLFAGACLLAYHRFFHGSLRTLHRYLEDLRRGDGQPVLPPPGPLPMAEAEGLRTALVAYEADLERLHERLDATNVELREQARHDSLTGLANRRRFQEQLEATLARVRDDCHEFALLYLDLDGFKHINDTFGHPTGDAFLVKVADRLNEAMDTEHLLARVGGDEFVILMATGDDPLQAARFAREILRLFEEPFRLEGHDLSVSASIGISRYPDDGTDATALIKNADAAVFQAKRQGRNQFQFYTPQLSITASERVELETGLRQALRNRELQLLYQPQIELASGRIVAAEALLRWHRPGPGTIPPDRFIPLAEETGLILDIGDWVLSEACHAFRHWTEAGLDIRRISVNISPTQIQRDTLLPSVENALSQSGIPGHCLELEVTEESWLNNLDRSIHTLHALRRRGLRVAVDDFGTGYSSLQYLKRLPVDVLKVDRSFIDDIPHDPNDVAITRAIIALSRSLGLEVVAEGVETEAQAAFLDKERCQLGQGYLFARPMTADALEALLRNGPILDTTAMGT